MVALVGGGDFEFAVSVVVGEEDTDPGATIAGPGGHGPRPLAAADRLGVTGVLEVDQVREFAGSDDVEPAVVVGVADGNVFGGGGFGAFGEGDKFPDVGVGAAEGDADVVVVFVDGDDVFIAVLVEVGELEAVAAADGQAAVDVFAIDEVLDPGDVLTVGGFGGGGRLGDGEGLRGRAAPEQSQKERSSHGLRL